MKFYYEKDLHYVHGGCLAATAFAQRGFTPPAELSDKYGFKVDGKTHL